MENNKTLLDQWREMAYNENVDKNRLQALWVDYFQKEKENLSAAFAKSRRRSKRNGKRTCGEIQYWHYDNDRILDGINDSLKIANPIETMDEETVVSLGFDKERLYKNMVAAEADWLYNLEEWNNIYDETTRKTFYREQKISGNRCKRSQNIP